MPVHRIRCPLDSRSADMPGSLQRMLAPIAPLAITGAIWYQGESNAERVASPPLPATQTGSDWGCVPHIVRKLFGQGECGWCGALPAL